MSFSVSLFPSSCAILSRIDHDPRLLLPLILRLCEREKFFIIPLNPIYDQVDVTPLRMRAIIFIKLADFLILRLPFLLPSWDIYVPLIVQGLKLYPLVTHIFFSHCNVKFNMFLTRNRKVHYVNFFIVMHIILHSLNLI